MTRRGRAIRPGAGETRVPEGFPSWPRGFRPWTMGASALAEPGQNRYIGTEINSHTVA